MAKKWVINLPSVFTKKNKLLIMVLAVFYSTFIYTTTNFNPIFTPQLLPQLWIDRITPFWPWTFWIYVTEYLLFLWAMLRFNEMREFDRYFYSFLSLQTFCVLIFIFFPTTFPRDLYPFPEWTDSVTRTSFEYFRKQADSPNNCLPSLHVASCYLTAFAFSHCKRWEFAIAFTWATLIAFSTMFTKQHYFVDVVAGLALSGFFYWVVYYRTTFYKVGARQPSR